MSIMSSGIAYEVTESVAALKSPSEMIGLLLFVGFDLYQIETTILDTRHFTVGLRQYGVD